jgi:hypothetical protein
MKLLKARLSFEIGFSRQSRLTNSDSPKWERSETRNSKHYPNERASEHQKPQIGRANLQLAKHQNQCTGFSQMMTVDHAKYFENGAILNKA